ncbi:hypothetical protein MKW92_031828 [Papaver armeniacum]|nr:hypothetical protein MKW92_031828 [Papaver armeniacum]
MASSNKTRNKFSSNNHPVCTRTNQILALILITTTFFLTRIFNQCCANNYSSFINKSSSQDLYFINNGWPNRGFGNQLSLKIYVYEENELDGLKELMYGRDGQITVKIHQMLLKSRFHTLKKEGADLFFVPTYVKCVRMMGGLTDKEINSTYNEIGFHISFLLQEFYNPELGSRIPRCFKSNAIFSIIRWARPHICFPQEKLTKPRAEELANSEVSVINHVKFKNAGGTGAHIFRSWPKFLNRSIILTPEGDRTDKKDTSAFNTWKDIIIPGNVDVFLFFFYVFLGMINFEYLRTFEIYTLANTEHLYFENLNRYFHIKIKNDTCKSQKKPRQFNYSSAITFTKTPLSFDSNRISIGNSKQK